MAKQARPTANLAPKLTVVRLSVITGARLSTFAGAQVLRVPDNKNTIDIALKNLPRLGDEYPV